MTAPLNGWQRLWIVVSAIYLLVVVGTVGFVWPTFETTDHRPEFIQRMPEAMRAHIAASYASEWEAREDKSGTTRQVMPNGAVLIIQSNRASKLKEIRAKYPQYNDLSNAQLVAKFPEYKDLSPVVWDDEAEGVVSAYFTVVDAAVRDGRRSTIEYALFAWIIPVAAIYALGGAVAWVRRGFRR
jgi:hypothetical protein